MGPLINGMRFDWSSATIKVDMDELEGIKEIDYSGALEPGWVYGNSAQPRGRTRGKYTAEGKMTVYRAEALELLRRLAQKGASQGKGFLEVVFQVVASYAEVDGEPIVDLIEGVRIKKHSDKGSEGGEALVTEFDLSIQHVRPNGLNPLGRMAL